MPAKFYSLYGKRIVDLLLTIPALLLLLPVFAVIAILIKLTAPGPVFFKQRRAGLNFQYFEIYKFRSMVVSAPSKGPSVTGKKDPRITRIGAFLRTTKTDELPQLFNVLKGEMSIVGPRPEVEKFVDAAKDDYVSVLAVKPGITDYAAIEFRDEETLMEKFADINKETGYIHEILPQKIALYKKYITNISLATDISLILKTVIKIFK